VRGAWLLLGKELRQAVRDRRTVFMTVAFPLVFYPLLFGLLGNLVGQEQARLEALVPRVLAVVPDQAPELAQALSETTELRVSFYPSVAALRRGLAAGAGEVGLEAERIPARGELGYRFVLYYRAEQQESQVGLAKLRAFLQGFLRQLTLEKLAAMGVEPAEVEPPFSVEVVDLGGGVSLGGLLLTQLLPYFLVLSILLGALGFGAEITAGEKERGTISTLLASCLSREEIVAGKFLAILTVSLASALLSSLGLLIGIQAFGGPLGQGGVSLAAAGWILVVLLPLAVALSAAVLIVGSFARTQKEASVYLLPLYMLVILVGMTVMFGGQRLQGAEYAIPVAGAMAAIRGALSGEVGVVEIGWSLASSTVVGGLLLLISVRIYRSEKVLFRI